MVSSRSEKRVDNPDELLNLFLGKKQGRRPRVTDIVEGNAQFNITRGSLRSDDGRSAGTKGTRSHLLKTGKNRDIASETFILPQWFEDVVGSPAEVGDAAEERYGHAPRPVDALAAIHNNGRAAVSHVNAEEETLRLHTVSVGGGRTGVEIISGEIAELHGFPKVDDVQIDCTQFVRIDFNMGRDAQEETVAGTA